MAFTSSTTYPAPRMQTNASWQSPPISYLAGSPKTPVDISSWTLQGVAVGAKGVRISLNATNQKIVFDSSTAYHVYLAPEDMALLGVGPVVIEVMRTSPAPLRPVIRLTGQNEHGVA